MAVAYGSSSSTTTTAAGTTYTVSAPSGTALDDVLVAFCVSDVGADTNITLTGGSTWNSFASRDTGTADYRAFWKVAGASEPASYTVGKTSGGRGHVSIVRATGALRASAPVFATSTSAAGTSISTPSVTPAGNADLLIRFACGSANGAFSGITFTAPAGHTKVTDAQAGAFVAGSAAYQLLASGAATGTATFTGSSSSLTDNSGITVALTIDSFPQTITPSGIATAEVFGTAQLNFTIIGQGLASGEAFGTAIVSTPQPQTVSGAGAIASGEAFGTLTTGLFLVPSGIATAETWGAARLAALIGPSGIATAETWGLTNVAIQQFLTPAAIASLEAFGTPTLQLGYPQVIIPEGIESAEVVEDPTIRNVDRLVLVNPSIQETPVAWDKLNVRFGLHRGITIMKDSLGVWRTLRYPAQTETEIAQRVYLGGRRHTISVAEANELIVAGYGSYILLEPDI